METRFGTGRERLTASLLDLRRRYRSQEDDLRSYVLNTPGQYATLQGYRRSSGSSYSIPAYNGKESSSLFHEQQAAFLGENYPSLRFSERERETQTEHNTLWARLEEAHLRASVAAGIYSADEGTTLIIMVRSVPYVTAQMQLARQVAGRYPIGHPARLAALQRISAYQTYLKDLHDRLRNLGALPADLQEDDGGLYYR